LDIDGPPVDSGRHALRYAAGWRRLHSYKQPTQDSAATAACVLAILNSALRALAFVIPHWPSPGQSRRRSVIRNLEKQYPTQAGAWVGHRCKAAIGYRCSGVSKNEGPASLRGLCFAFS